MFSKFLQWSKQNSLSSNFMSMIPIESNEIQSQNLIKYVCTMQKNAEKIKNFNQRSSSYALF